MFVSRDGWQARKPKTSLSPIGRQSTVFIHHSVTNPTGDPKADTRQIQNFHMDSRNYADIAYTLLVHPDGTVLEGRTVGGQAAQGAHTSGYNSKSVAICAIGNYEQDQVPDSLIAGINEALAYMVSKRWVIESPKVRPHSDVGFTQCCGKFLKARIGEIKVGSVPGSGSEVLEFEEDDMKTAIKQVTIGGDGRGYVLFDGQTKATPWGTLNSSDPVDADSNKGKARYGSFEGIVLSGFIHEGRPGLAVEGAKAGAKFDVRGYWV